MIVMPTFSHILVFCVLCALISAWVRALGVSI